MHVCEHHAALVRTVTRLNTGEHLLKGSPEVSCKQLGEGWRLLGRACSSTLAPLRARSEPLKARSRARYAHTGYHVDALDTSTLLVD